MTFSTNHAGNNIDGWLGFYSVSNFIVAILNLDWSLSIPSTIFNKPSSFPVYRSQQNALNNKTFSPEDLAKIFETFRNQLILLEKNQQAS